MIKSKKATLKIVILLNIAIGICFSNCKNIDKPNQLSSSDSKEMANYQDDTVSGKPCDITINNVHFTKSVNNAESLITYDDNGKVVFTTGEKTDYFKDPDGKLSNNSAPILLTHIDNTKPFTFTARVTPEFVKGDMYNAGVLYLYVNDSFFQKLCFEEDERGNHRVVTVRTVGSSDDNNHDIAEQPYVYMKISSDAKTVASYYSLDNKNWQMVRLYENNYPKEMWVGISTQCPVGKGSKSLFEEIVLEKASVKDFRLGI